MAYELQVKPMPARVAEAFEGQSAELRELAYGAMTDAMRAGRAQERSSESLFGASLHVDGKPVGLDALLSMPGRFAGVISEAMAECIRMHGLVTRTDDEEQPAANDDEGSDAPKH